MAKKILVVDDEQSVRELIKTILEKQGYEVIVASDGNECLEQVSQLIPDLIILDIMMPHLPGGVAADKLAEVPETRNIPIIFLTAVFDEEEANIVENRFAGHKLLAKPVDPEVLLKTISEVLGE